jgi:hypothetical protein
MLAMLNIFSISICDLGIPKNAQTKNATLRKKKSCIFHHMDFTLTSLTIMQWYNDDSVFTKNKLIVLVKVATSP